MKEYQETKRGYLLVPRHDFDFRQIRGDIARSGPVIGGRGLGLRAGRRGVAGLGAARGQVNDVGRQLGAAFGGRGRQGHARLARVRRGKAWRSVAWSGHQ